MKANRIILLAVMLFSMTALYGCMDVKNMTEEEADMVAEYSAGVLLRYSDTYPWRLVTQEQAEKMEETPAPSWTSEAPATPAPTTEITEQGVETKNIGQTQPVTEEKNETVKKASLQELLGLKGIKIHFKGTSLCRSYKNIQVPDGSGEELLVAEFEIQNTTSSAQKINLMKKKLEYPLEVNGQIYLTGINILRGNDLNYLDVRIGAKKKVKAVLIYNIPESVAKKQTEGTLTVRDTATQEEVSYEVSIT